MKKTALAIAAVAAALSAGAEPPAPPDAAAGTAPPKAAAPAAPPASAPSQCGANAPPGKPPVERGTVLEEVSGTVAGIDRKAHRLRVDTPSGPVTLSLDRNTMVYTATGLGTPLDVSPGAQIRAGRNADFLAYWVQVRKTAASPSTTPGQGTGPAGGASAPASEGAGPGAAPAPAPPTTGTGPGPAGPSTGGVQP